MFEFVARGQVPFRTLVSSEETWLLTRVADTYAGTGDRDRESPIRPLLAAKHHVLRETLTAYVECGNAVSAAHRLGVHPQTMRYRLRRIRDVTGRDPADGWDRFVLELALRAHTMTTAVPGEPAEG
jgi:sugar diacid utilization regulator